MRLKLILYFVSFAAFLGPFTQTIYTPILPEVQNALQTTPFMIHLSISIFTIFLAILQIFYGPLTDQQGRRKILLPGISIYVFASFGCAYASSIHFLLFFRVLQSIGIATGSVVATTVIGDLFEGTARGRSMAVFQTLVALGPASGPVIGGLVGGHFGYRGVFIVLSIAGLLIFLGNIFFLPETKPSMVQPSFNLYSNYTIVLSHPVGRNVILLGFIQYYTFYTFIVFLPDFLAERFPLTALQKGFVLLPLSLMMVTGSLLGGRLQERFSKSTSLIFTCSFNIICILLFMLFSSFSLWVILCIVGFYGFFFGLALPVQTTMLADSFVDERGTAIGMYNFLRYMGQAAGPVVGGFLYSWGKIMLLMGCSAILFAFVVFFVYRQFKEANVQVR